MDDTAHTTAQPAAYTGSIPKAPLGFVFFVGKQTPLLAWGAILAVTLASLCSVFLPFVLKQIIDQAMLPGSEDSVTLLVWVAAFPTLIFVMYLLWRVSGFVGMLWLTRAETFAYSVLFEHLSQHSHTYFIDRFAGSVTNKLSHAAEGTFRLLDGTLWGHYGAVISLVATGYFIFMTSLWVGCIYLVLILILIPTNVYLAKWRRPHVVEYASLKTAMKGQMVDVVTNIGAMRQYARRDKEATWLNEKIEVTRLADVRQWRISEWALVFNNIIIAVSLAAIMFVMYYLWRADAVTVGDFVLVLTLLLNLQGTLIFIGNAMNQFIRIYGELEEGLHEVLIDHEVADVPNAQKLVTSGGAIEWNNVTFEFGDHVVFREFNLSIKPGQRVGLVGHSGAGKTTFVSLLLRQHDITAGAILIDGQDIAMVTQDSLRENIAVVPQEPMLFHRTIKENIAYGKDGASDEEIIAVAKKAQAHDFISELEKGYDTLVGERGIKLSGGQKQRIAIARAMLKNAPILILDEATSALDSESEVLIQKALHELMEGKTVIAVAHRLSTLRKMDRIIVLENGKIIEDGTHLELAQGASVYQRLWEHQAGGFLQD